MVRIIRWKYREKNSTGFAPDVMKIAHKYNLWSYIQTFWRMVPFQLKCNGKEWFLRQLIAMKKIYVHAVLRCKISFDIRENFWKWILDNIPMDFCGYFSQLDDDGFLNINKTVIMVFGEEKNRSNIASERIWLLGDAPLKESNIWKNLGKLWHVDPDSAEIVRVTVNKGFDAISKLAKLGCRTGGLNPKIAARLWETIRGGSRGDQSDHATKVKIGQKIGKLK